MGHRVRSLLPDVLAAGALVALALAASHAAWRGSYTWTPDGYFYEAQVLELQGRSPEAARSAVFEGPLTAERRAMERRLGRGTARVADPDWVAYSADFYRRRWLVPLIAAAVEPLLGLRSLITVSLVGLLGTMLALFTLLRLRFDRATSALAAGVVGLSPAVVHSAIHPLTDSTGLALETTALVGLVLWLTRGARWLPLWLLPLAALSVTRENGVVLVLTAGLYALLRRSQAALVAALVGAAVLLPAYVLAPVDPGKLLAFTLNDRLVPPSSDLGFIVDHYPHGAYVAFVRNFTVFGGEFGAAGGLVLVIGALMLLLVARRSVLVDVLRATVPACAVYLLSLPQPSFRLWIVLAPAAAGGYAAAAERLGEATRAAWRGRRAMLDGGREPERRHG